MNDAINKGNSHQQLEGAPAIGQIFRHYKGGLYVVVQVSIMEDTLEPLVTYRSNMHGTTWTRTLANFGEMLEFCDGRSLPRFRRESD